MALETIKGVLGREATRRFAAASPAGQEELLTRKLQNRLLALQEERLFPLQIKQLMKQIEYMTSPLEVKEAEIEGRRKLAEFEGAIASKIAQYRADVQKGIAGQREYGETRRQREKMWAAMSEQGFVGPKEEPPTPEQLDVAEQHYLKTGELSGLQLAKSAPGVSSEFRFTKAGTELSLKYLDRAEKMSEDYRTVENNLLNIVAGVNRLEAMPEDEETRLAVNQAVITSFNKITDPTSVVRESEYQRTPEGASLVNRLKAKYEKVTKGGVLTNEDIIELRDTALQLSELRRELINEKLTKQIREPAAKRGLDPEEIAPLFRSMQEEVQTGRGGVGGEYVPEPDGFDYDAHINMLMGE